MSMPEGPSLPFSSLSTTPSTVQADVPSHDSPLPPPTAGPSRAASVFEPSQLQVTTTATENASQTSTSQVNGKQPKRTVVPNVEKAISEARKRSRLKGRSWQDEEATAQSAARVAVSIAADQNAALNPDIDTPFRDATDVVQRLLPYHLFQHPAEDLAALRRHAIGKGKRKATEEDLLREEIAETKFALQCWKRRRTLEKRFRAARTNAAKRDAPDDQLYVLTQAIVESDRHENANLNAELKLAKQELEKIEREKRAAAASATPPPPPPAPRTSYYQAHTHTTTSTTATPTAYPTQYRGYTYTYGQGYNSQYTYTPYQTSPVPPNAWSTSVFSQTPRSTTTQTPYASTAYTTQSTAYTTPSTRTTSTIHPTTSASTTIITPTSVTPSTSVSTPTTVSQPAQTAQPSVTAPLTTTGPIPVQLPVSSLTALSSLGIVPVPAANAPPPGQPQPAAVLKGTTPDGSMINLEINIASLQQSQMNGLAILLSALTSRGVNVDTTAAAATLPDNSNVGSGTAAPPPNTVPGDSSSETNAPSANGTGGNNAPAHADVSAASASSSSHAGTGV